MHTANARSANATLTKAFNKYEVSDQDAKSIIRAVYLLTAKKVEDANEQETAPPMTPERAVEVATLYGRAEAAAAIVTAAVRWRKYPINWQAELTKAIDHYVSLSR